MKQDAFDIIVKNRLEFCTSLMINKSVEYSGTEDKLENFKIAAAIDGETPEQALWGMWKKHIASIIKIHKDFREKGIIPSQELITEKYTDSINYHILSEALFEERRNGS